MLDNKSNTSSHGVQQEMVKQGRPLLAGICDALAIVGPPVCIELQSLLWFMKSTLQSS